MSLSLVSEVWDALRQHIQLADKVDAADTLVNPLIDSGYDADEIKENFRGDKEIANALSYFSQEEDVEYDDDEDYEDDDEWWYVNWYTKITGSLSVIPDFISYYESELLSAKNDVKVFGNVEKNISSLPGITEHRFNQLQEIEAVLNYLNIQLRKIRQKHFKKYLEAYNRALTSRDAEKYVDGEDEVIDFETIVNDVALLRNKWLGIMKGLDSKQWQLGHIVRLRTAGMEDITIK